jgi:hypothetical protein
MATTTFSGPIRTGSPAAVPANETIGTVIAAKTIALPVTAVATTDFVLKLPKSRVMDISVFTDTAYGAVTDAQLTIGSTVGGAQYVAAVSIKAAAKVIATLASGLSGFPTLAEGTSLNLRVTQTGGNSAVGNATVVVTYLQVA